ncbi:hypothetical protein AB0M92_08375 [Streptomyces sp. NPDC051582]|uniref:hypothetical protein n=1 Tax=Streptomyces sp. NPDC051582 TaxID=3155167 RepID=UPI00343869A8
MAPRPPGRARLAGEPDAPLVARWFGEYTREVGEPAGGDLLEVARRRIEERQITFWESRDLRRPRSGFTAGDLEG